MFLRKNALTNLKNALTNSVKCQGEFFRLSWLALLDIICQKPLYTASLIKTSVMFQTDCVPMCYGEPTLVFFLHIPFSPLKRFWKERFTAFIVSFCFSISLKRETIFSLIYYVYTCERINIKVCFESLFPSFPKSFLPTSLRISVLQKSPKKPCMKVWWICFKALILHPLSREKGDTVDMLRRKKVMNDRLIKTFWNFFFKKFWWFKNLPYLCIRFPKESLKRRVLWKI